MAEMETALLLGSGLLLGLRHGADWDHIAAISDVSSTQSEVPRTLFLGTMYALGHSAIIVILGALAVFLGAGLTEGVDQVMEQVVGVTLIGLGLWVFYSLARHRQHFHLRSRWMLLFGAALTGYDWLRARVAKAPANKKRPLIQGYGAPGACGLGVVHGIGAETPTQVMFFALAAGGGITMGFLLIGAFVLGLLASNLVISALCIFGFLKSRDNARAYRAVGAVTGVFSLGVGVLFLTGQGSLLPALLGG